MAFIVAIICSTLLIKSWYKNDFFETLNILSIFDPIKMKKIITQFSLVLLGILLTTQVKSQTGCHASYSFHQLANTLTVDFTDQSTSPNAITSWLWDFGDGSTSTSQNSSHAYAHEGSYYVCLTIHDDHGCSHTSCQHITVEPISAPCHASFSFHQIANTLTVNFTDLSTSSNTITSWHWDFGDGETSDLQNPEHTYAHDGTYNVCLTIHDESGCSNTYCHHFKVEPISADCHAAFSFEQIANTFTVNFTDESTSSNTITSWSWDFGDGNTSDLQNPSHTYSHDGTYTVCLTIHDDKGCSNHSCIHITLHHGAPPCHASFTFYVDPTGTLVHFQNTSTGTTANTKYSWDFGDGETSTDENPTHTYAQPGHYIVCLFILDESTGCSSHFCHEVNIHHNDHHFHVMGDYNTLQSQSFSDLTSKGKQYIINYPNPTKTSTTLQYELIQNANVTIEIYDFLGNRKEVVSSGLETKGLHTPVINMSGLNSGFYFIKMIADGETFKHKITVLK